MNKSRKIHVINKQNKNKRTCARLFLFLHSYELKMQKRQKKIEEKKASFVSTD